MQSPASGADVPRVLDLTRGENVDAVAVGLDHLRDLELRAGRRNFGRSDRDALLSP